MGLILSLFLKAASSHHLLSSPMQHTSLLAPAPLPPPLTAEGSTRWSAGGVSLSLVVAVLLLILHLSSQSFILNQQDHPLTKHDITDQRYEAERAERKSSRRPSRSRRSERNERDEYSEDDSTDEFKPKTPKALEAPPASSSSGTADFVGERTRREREKEESYVGASAGERRDRERERERETRWEDEEISGGRGRY